MIENYVKFQVFNIVIWQVFKFTRQARWFFGQTTRKRQQEARKFQREIDNSLIQPYLVNYFWLKGQFISLRFLNYNYLFSPIWTNSDQSGSFWTNLDHFGPIWTNLDHFGPFWTISLVFYDLCTGNGAQYGTSVVLNMPLTTQIVFEFFLAILANIVGLFRMHVPYMLSHVIFKINLFSTNQTFKSGFSIIVKNFLIFCLHFQDILFVCSYTCNNLNIKFFQAGRSKRKLKNFIWGN